LVAIGPAAKDSSPPAASATTTDSVPPDGQAPSPLAGREHPIPFTESGAGATGESLVLKPLPEPPTSTPVPAGPAGDDDGKRTPAESGEAHAPDHLPWFVTAPGGTDYLFNAMAALVIVAVIAIGNLFFKLHALPERWAHGANPIQIELVAVLSLIGLFTHQHIFWVAALFLAMVRFPDFGTPLRSMSRSLAVLARRFPPTPDRNGAPGPSKAGEGPLSDPDGGRA